MDAGAALVKHFEQLRLSPYQDRPGGVWTIGWGATRDLSRKRVSRDTMPVTEAEAELLFQRDFAIAANAVDHYIKVPLNENQRAALRSFTFNLGEAHLASSTLLKVLNGGEYGRVPGELARWVFDDGVKLQGLVVRRAAEAQLWDTPVEPPRIAQD